MPHQLPASSAKTSQSYAGPQLNKSKKPRSLMSYSYDSLLTSIVVITILSKMLIFDQL